MSLFGLLTLVSSARLPASYRSATEQTVQGSHRRGKRPVRRRQPVSGPQECVSNTNTAATWSSASRRLTRNPSGASTLFMIDGKIQSPTAPQQLQDLPERPPGNKRHGGQTVWEQDGIRVTMALEAIPSQGKPWRNTPRGYFARHLQHRKLCQCVRKVGCRAVIDTAIDNNDGPLFASPFSHPNLVLNRYLFRNQDVPHFIELLQRPDLRDPGPKGIFTFKLGETLEGPDKVVLTSSDVVRRDQWDVRAEKVNGRSACVLFWEPRDLEPKGRRELAFAYGQGIAATNEGQCLVDFGGSFEPGKSFTITAYVDRPIEGQSLTLQLPKGMELVHGKATQIVPPADENARPSVVVWRCQLAEVGTYPIGIRSNHGVTQTWTVTVSPQ